MIRGTTPTHIFTLPFTADQITKLSIAYAQGEDVVLEKVLGDCVLDGNTVSVQLTETDTLKFSDLKQVEIQLRVGIGEARLASNVIYVTVDRLLRDGGL